MQEPNYEQAWNEGDDTVVPENELAIAKKKSDAAVASEYAAAHAEFSGQKESE